jgi:cytochrome b
MHGGVFSYGLWSAVAVINKQKGSNLIRGMLPGKPSKYLNYSDAVAPHTYCRSIL